MPWVPELFTAPTLQRILDERRRDELVSVPYFDGLMAGDPDPLVESFAGEPELHDPVRGRIRGEAAFRAFVRETSGWLHECHASVDDVDHVVRERSGFEEVVLHLDTDRGRVDLPVGVVAEREPDGRIDEVRVYFSSRPLTGRRTSRPPLLQADPGLPVPDAVRTYYARLFPAGGVSVEPCALVDDGRVCALEHNVVRGDVWQPRRQAGLGVFSRGRTGAIAEVRAYGDTAPDGPGAD